MGMARSSRRWRGEGVAVVVVGDVVSTVSIRVQCRNGCCVVQSPAVLLQARQGLACWPRQAAHAR